MIDLQTESRTCIGSLLVANNRNSQFQDGIEFIVKDQLRIS